jgi:uncharacterized protein YjiS (DUF1127 family)
MQIEISCTAASSIATQHDDPIFPLIPANCRRKGRNVMLSPVIRFFQSWKRYGLAAQELSQLSDRELADIGITRSDIPRIAWEQSHQ